jgi:electron transfer flavoprotein beta subunit
MTGNRPGAGPVVACLRVCDLHPEVDPLTGAIRTEAAGLGLSTADAAALERALQAAEAWTAPVVAVTVGPPAADRVLRDVAALGVAVLRVEAGGPADADAGEQLAGDERGQARQVADAVVRTFGRPRLVVCGDRSVDRGTGAFPGFLAHELGAVQALGLVALSPVGPGRRAVGDKAEAGSETGCEGVRDGLLAERRLDGGWRERLFVPLPAVCSVEGAGVRLRRAGLGAALATAQLEVPVFRAPTSRPAGAERVQFGAPRPFAPRPRIVPAPTATDPHLRILDLCGALVERDPPVVLGPLDSGAAADEFLGFLDRHGYLEKLEPGAASAGAG